MNTNQIGNRKSEIGNETGFHFKKFQLEDYARLCLHDGGVLGHDTGGGKGLALFVLAALKCGFERSLRTATGEPTGLKPLKPVLIVAPGDLHDQIIAEGRLHFKATVTRLDSQATFLKLARVNPAGGAPILPPGYYLTSYSQLASNGVREFPKYDPANWLGMMHQLGLTEGDAITWWSQRGEIFAREYKRLSAEPGMSLKMLENCYLARKANAGKNERVELEIDFLTLAHLHTPQFGGEFNDLTNEQQEWCLQRTVADAHREYSNSIGSHRWYQAVTPPAIKRTEGRLGEENEFVEFDDGTVRHIAQKVRDSDDWNVYRAEGDAVEVLKSFGDRADAVNFATSVAYQPKSEIGNRKSEMFKVKCVYDPSLADLSQDSFAGVCVDEGVRMKGEETEIGLGVRQMNPKYRFVLSATPIKNRLPDVFRLAWWATGALAEAHARWPYPDSSSAREEFATEFLISERNLSKEKKAESKRRYLKLTPQVCNIHRLWKLFAPVILRRRKRDFGEDIVTKTRHVVRVPMGLKQAEVYKFHLDAEYLDTNGRPAIGAQLQALRIAAANPCSELLHRPAFDRKTKGEPRSRETHIPKLHAAFKLISQILARGEQCVVFSAFHDSLDALSARLQEAGVRHCTLDGRTSQTKRAAIAAQFKLGPPKSSGQASPYPLMLAGVECMAEGHSFHLCNNVILLCYSWAYDKFEQAINRVHRLNSKWPVNVYPIICEGSIDRKLEALIQEKGDAAELVLDGKLLAEHSAEVNLAELLHTARAEFAGKVVVDELTLEKDWPALRMQLSEAAKAWSRPWMQSPNSQLPTPISQPPVRFQVTTTATTVPTAEARPMIVAPAKPRPAVFKPAPNSHLPSPNSQTATCDGLALWQQSGGGKLPKRPLPFARKK
jgi:SNF2-related domain/Helicase conserved C-terminal domain